MAGRNMQGKNNPMYGVHRFGKNAPSWGRKHSEETKRKIGLKSLGRRHSIKYKRETNKLNLKEKQTIKDGYILYYAQNHPNKMRNNYIFEHRLIMEKKLGRYLTKDEIVHHINGITTDNRIANLQLFENHGKHLKFHSQTF